MMSRAGGENWRMVKWLKWETHLKNESGILFMDKIRM